MVRFIAVLLMCLIVPINCVSQDTPTLPDNFKQWEEIGATKPSVAINGKDMGLALEYFIHTDLTNLERQTVNLLYDEKFIPWFLTYFTEKGEKHPDDSITTKESHLYLFENVNDKWVFVKDFSNAPFGPEFYSFLKDRYGLEFK